MGVEIYDHTYIIFNSDTVSYNDKHGWGAGGGMHTVILQRNPVPVIPLHYVVSATIFVIFTHAQLY